MTRWHSNRRTCESVYCNIRGDALATHGDMGENKVLPKVRLFVCVQTIRSLGNLTKDWRAEYCTKVNSQAPLHGCLLSHFVYLLVIHLIMKQSTAQNRNRIRWTSQSVTVGRPGFCRWFGSPVPHPTTNARKDQYCCGTLSMSRAEYPHRKDQRSAKCI